MQVLRREMVGRFSFVLARRRGLSGLWRWAIIADDGTSRAFVFSPGHWRETEGDESPFRPFDAFSFMVENEIDPSKSDGWNVVERQVRAA